jgi:hypothetical protein
MGGVEEKAMCSLAAVGEQVVPNDGGVCGRHKEAC